MELRVTTRALCHPASQLRQAKDPPFPTPSLSFFIYKPRGWLPKWLEALGGNEAHGSHTAPGT